MRPRSTPRPHSTRCRCYEPAIQSVKYYLPILKKFPRLRREQRKKLFEEGDKCFIKFIGECCKSVLCDIIKLPEKAYKKLKRHKDIKKDLKYLASDSIPVKRKRALLINKGGGFLSIILPALASSLFGLIGEAAIKHFQG
jgi:hypothetical protein